MAESLYVICNLGWRVHYESVLWVAVMCGKGEENKHGRLSHFHANIYKTYSIQTCTIEMDVFTQTVSTASLPTNLLLFLITCAS
jgi:hypothetical protein